MPRRISQRYPDAYKVGEYDDLLEGCSGTLLDVWTEDVFGASVTFGLWQDEQPTDPADCRFLLHLGSAAQLEAILAEVGPLPARHWLYREPCFPPPGYVGPWPRPRRPD